ncbi:DNA-binding transcriptional regulator, LysR family [Eubacterium ruminantium]|nr:DNA-binding transcriptional regulator, LysR family [Eubacterium ruminantium]
MTLQQLRYAVTIADCGSINEAAKRLFISQPSLSGSVKELEDEIGFDIYIRSNRGIVITPEGEEFMSYARQVLDQYTLLQDRFLNKTMRQKFGVSTQHYSFAVKAFIEVVNEYGMDNYEFAVHETRTEEVIENVRFFKSEVGVLYENDFNRKVLEKIFNDNSLEFIPLFDCDTFVYLWSEHPLASKEEISIDELADYPCLAFDQGIHGSLFLAEEQLSTYEHKQLIRANDRATMFNLMIGLNGFTLCSGIISEELNGDAYKAIPLKESEKMTIGYIKRKGISLSNMGRLYVEKLSEYKKYAYNR